MRPDTTVTTARCAALDDHVSTLTWSPGGLTLAAGSLGGDSILLDPATGDVVAKLPAHPLGVLTTAWSSDGDRLAIGGQDGILRLSDRVGAEVAAVDLGDWVADVAWSPAPSGYLAVAAGRVLCLVGPDGAVVRSFAAAPSTITSIAWSPDGRRIGVAAYGGLRWHEPTKPSEDPLRTFAWKGSLLSAVVAPNGRWACAGSQEATIHLWRLWSGDDLSMSGYPAKVEHLAFRHDSRWMASACMGDITVWDFSGKGPAGSRPAQGEAHERHVTDLAWQPRGDLLATGGADGRLALWASPRRQGKALNPLHVGDGEAGVSRLAWSPDGTRLAVGRSDGTVELSDVS